MAEARDSENAPAAAIGAACTEALGRKLSCFCALDPADMALLAGIATWNEQWPPDYDLALEGRAPRSMFVITEGLACRYRNMPDGRRQIINFLLPGDLCDLNGHLLRIMDHSIASLSPLRVTAVSREAVGRLLAEHVKLGAALWWCLLQEQAILRERVVALGRRRALGRVAYLLCELWWRHDLVGLANGRSISLPLTQAELADAAGLTPVHVNRILMALRDERLIRLSHRQLTIMEPTALESVADFNPEYLHLRGCPPEIAQYFDRNPTK